MGDALRRVAQHTRRRAVTVVAVAGVVVAGATVPALAATPGSVTVTVTSSADGSLVGGVCVNVFDPTTFDFLGADCSDVGSPSVLNVGGLVDGTQYQVELSVGTASGFLAPDASVQFVTAPADVSFVVDPGVVVQGRLSYQDGTLPFLADVTLQPTDPTQNQVTASAFAGRWSTVVRPGAYTVHYFDNSTGYEQWAFGATSADTATAVDVARPGPVQVDDVLLQGSDGQQPPVTVTGHITDAATGAPLAGICPVFAFPGDPAPQLSSCADAQTTPSAADGSYSIDIAAGDAAVFAVDPTSTYAPASRSLTLAVGDHPVVDLALQRAGTVSGTVVDAKTGAPLGGLCPSAQVGRTPEFVGRTECSDATGRWKVSGLAPGQVTVLVGGDATHVDLWVPGVDTQATAKLLDVKSGVTTDAGTMRMQHGATLTGRVTDKKGNPLAGIYVNVGGFPWRAGPGEGRWTTQTGPDGRYTIPNIGRQKQTVVFYAYPTESWGIQWNGGAPDPAAADPLFFQYGKTLRQDAVMVPGANLTATISGLGSSSALLDTFTLSGVPNSWGQDAFGDGPVTVGAMPSSKVLLRVTVGDGPSVTYWYRKGGLTTDQSLATPIEVKSGRTTSVAVKVPSQP